MSPSSELDEAGRDFAAAAEQHRRDSDAHAAITLAEQGLARHPNNGRGRVALALALLDAGEPARAKLELERLLQSGEFPASADGRGAAAAVPAAPTEAAPTFEHAVADHEIEDAFADAETNPDEMMDANTVVEQTLRGEAFDAIEPFDVSEHPTYATRTMASLLEQQGRPAEASALRTSLGEAHVSADSAPGWDGAAGDSGGSTERGADAAALERRRSLATLESWLRNVRAGSHAASQQRGVS